MTKKPGPPKEAVDAAAKEIFHSFVHGKLASDNELAKAQIADIIRLYLGIEGTN